MKARQLYIALSLILTMPLHGCFFTGIESTPKITAGDVKREHLKVSDEQQFLSEVAPQPFGEWEPGKRFYVTDYKIYLIFQPSQYPTPEAGSILTYAGHEAVTSVTGETETDIAFLSETGERFIYRLNFSPEELAEKESVEVPFTIEMSIVEQIRSYLAGNSYYITTTNWYDLQGNMLKGQRFVQVDVVDVLPGNQNYPTKVLFRKSKEQQSNEYELFMSIGSSKQSTRNFETLFSFKNPKNNYPQISADIWENIINSRIAVDMTREECRLSLGAPNSIDRRPMTGGLFEVWGYDDGKYLIFEDGLLRNFRL